MSLDELDPGREDFVDCGICGAFGFLAQPVDEQEVTDREDDQVRIAVTQRVQQSLGQIRGAQTDFARRHPIPRKHGKVGILFVLKRDTSTATSLPPSVLVAGPSMVEVMDHLRFVERQVLLRFPAKHVAFEIPAVGFKLLSLCERVFGVGSSC